MLIVTFVRRNMGTRIVTRSGKDQCVSNEPLEKKCVTVLGHKTNVWIFPSDESDSSLSEESADEMDEDESVYEFDGIPIKQLGCKVKYLSKRRSQRLAQNCASVPRCNSIPIEKKCVTVFGLKTKAWTFLSDETDSEDEDEYLIERSCIETTPTHSAMGDLGAVPSLELKELLFRLIVILLWKNGFSDSVNVLRKEAHNKEDGGATPPDIEGY